jgi:ABC-type Fe3+ transport system permease subunit
MERNASSGLVLGRKLQFATAKLRNRPDILLALIFLLVFAFLVIAPLVQIIYTSLIYQSNDLRVVRDARVGQFTLYHYARIFSGRLARSIFYKPFLNSLLVGLGVTLFAMVDSELEERRRGRLPACPGLPYCARSLCRSCCPLSAPPLS